MPFDILFDDAVLAYLENKDGLPAVLRESVLIIVEDYFSRAADQLLVARPLGHESLRFDYDYSFSTPTAVFEFQFYADAANAEVGVIRVVFAECDITPAP